jgi:PAS domain-containing protein
MVGAHTHTGPAVSRCAHSFQYRVALQEIAHRRSIAISVLVARRKAVMARASEMKLSSVLRTVRESEESLRVTQARLESTLEASSVGTWNWDIAGDRLIADEFTARLFSLAAGAAAEGLPAAAYLQVVHEEDRKKVADALERAILLCSSYDIEYRILQSDGAFRWLSNG